MIEEEVGQEPGFPLSSEGAEPFVNADLTEVKPSIA